jgi:hypothetical protein
MAGKMAFFIGNERKCGASDGASVMKCIEMAGCVWTAQYMRNMTAWYARQQRWPSGREENDNIPICGEMATMYLYAIWHLTPQRKYQALIAVTTKRISIFCNLVKNIVKSAAYLSNDSRGFRNNRKDNVYWWRGGWRRRQRREHYNGKLAAMVAVMAWRRGWYIWWQLVKPLMAIVFSGGDIEAMAERRDCRRRDVRPWRRK